MTKAQAKKRLKEIKSKAAKIIFSGNYDVSSCMGIRDYEAIEKVVDRCLKRLK